jgi:dTDP-4-dehydrorhamnose reductase
MKRKVFITGDSGMLGGALKEILKKDSNYEILDVDRYRTYINEFHYFQGQQVKPAEVDINNLKTLQAIFHQFITEIDIVINCAAYVNTDKCVDFSYEAVMSNVIGTQNIVGLCKKYNCTLINFSTTAVFDPEYYMEYFDGKFDETTLANPKTIYGATKYACELAAKQGCEKVITIKPVFIYGNFPYDNSSNLTKIFKQILLEQAGVLMAGKLPITLSCEFKKNYMHSDYFALMMKQIIDNTDKCLGKDFIISRDPECGKTFDKWLNDLGEVLDVQLDASENNYNNWDVTNYIDLKPEADYLKDHLGYSANFYRLFPDFKLPDNHKDDIYNLTRTFKSIQSHFQNA